MSSPHDKPQPHKNDKQDARTATHKVAEESSHIFDEYLSDTLHHTFESKKAESLWESLIPLPKLP